jgi:carbon storage regulator
MLVIGRKRDEKLVIDGNIEITILKVGRSYVRLGVESPRDIPISVGTTRSEKGRPSGLRPMPLAAGKQPG